jgi:hypothetical protein
VAITTGKQQHLAEHLPENGSPPGSTYIAPH